MLLRTMVVSAPNLLDNRWKEFRFEPIKHSAGKTYKIVLSSPDSGPGNTVTIYCDKKNNIAIRLYALATGEPEIKFEENQKITALINEKESNLEKIELEIAKREQELQSKNSEIQLKNNEIAKREQELQSKNSEIQLKNNEIVKREQELQSKNNEIQLKNNEIVKREQELKQIHEKILKTFSEI